MKKLLLFASILFFTTANATDSTKLSAKEVYEDVKAGFDKLVTNLEGPAKYTYTSYVKHYKISGVSSMIAWAAPLVGTLIMMIICLPLAKWEDGEPNRWGVTQIIVSIFFCICTIGILTSMGTMLSQITNPQYHAIQEIIKALG